MTQNRRNFIRTTAMTAVSGILLPDALLASSPAAAKIRVLVWDERSDAQKEGYDNFLGNCIADHLKTNPAFSVVSMGLDDADQGISDKILDNTDVVIWWGHVKHDEITPEKGKEIVKRIASGSLSMIALHSAHWATPFVEAMNEITRLRTFSDKTVKEEDVRFIPPPKRYMLPLPDARLTPYTVEHKFPNGSKKLDVYLPICCFPSVRNDGKPGTIKLLKKDHPIVKGIPATFQIPQTEMYSDPFHVPQPDIPLFEESWETGEWFPSGSVWQLGKGKVFYFRPGHETYPIFKQELPLQILSNAVQWMGQKK